MSTKFKLGAIGVGVFLFILLIYVAMITTRIPNGYVGIVYSVSGGVQDQTLSQGWHTVKPFDKVTKYPIRIQTVDYKDLQIATSDGKNITIDFAYNYQIEPDKVVNIFNTFGPVSIKEIEDSYLRTRFWDAARKAVSKFTVIDVYGEKSSEAAVEVQSFYSNDVKELGFIVSNVTVGVPKPDQKTQEAIDKRVEASQELERKTTELEIAKKEADRKRVEAQGQADARVIEAEGSSKANELVKQSLTNELIQKAWIDKWNGVVPTVNGTEGLILDIGGIK